MIFIYYIFFFSGILQSSYEPWMDAISHLVEIDGNITVQFKIMDVERGNDYDTLKQG